MSCREHDDMIVDVARGVVGDLEAAALVCHVAGCERCAARLRRERALTAGLRALDGATPGEGASPGVEAALLAAFPASQPSVPGVAPSRIGAWRVWMAAAAALALVALGSLMVLRDGRTPETPVPSRLDTRPVPGLRAFDALAPVVQGQHASLATPPAGNRAATGALRPGGGSVAGGGAKPGAFVPWPGAATLPAFENGELIRK
ncbi:MAG: zf-HC2 domain-containing protein, partial [Acidobacteria bacterium]